MPRAEIAAQLEEAAVVANRTEVDQDADAVQPCRIGAVFTRLENGALSRDAEADERADPALAIEHAFHREREALEIGLAVGAVVIGSVVAELHVPVGVEHPADGHRAAGIVIGLARIVEPRGGDLGSDVPTALGRAGGCDRRECRNAGAGDQGSDSFHGDSP
jgi:hypothetical protein